MHLQSTSIQLGCEVAHLYTFCSLLNSCKQKAPRLCFSLMAQKESPAILELCLALAFSWEKLMLLPCLQNYWDPKSNDIQEQFSNINLAEKVALGMPCLEVPCSWVGHFRTGKTQPVWEKNLSSISIFCNFFFLFFPQENSCHLNSDKLLNSSGDVSE